MHFYVSYNLKAVQRFLSFTSFPPFFFLFQLFYCIGEVEIIVKNTGKVGFNFTIIHCQSEEQEADKGAGLWIKTQKDGGLEKTMEVRPGRPMVIPALVS